MEALYIFLNSLLIFYDKILKIFYMLEKATAVTTSHAWR